MYPSFITSATTTVLLPPVLFYAIRSVLMSPVATMAAVAADRRCAITRGGDKLIKRMCQTSEAAKLWRPAIIPFAFA